MTYVPAGGVGLDPAVSGAPVPAPPQGPGAVPPFASPPTERDKRRMWIGLGIGGAVLLLCCAGGIGGIGVIFMGGIEQAKRQATATVEEYLDAVLDGNTRAARSRICEDLEPGVTAQELESRTRQTGFSSYRLGDAELSATIDVPVTLNTGGGSVEQLYLVGSEGSATCIVDILPR